MANIDNLNFKIILDDESFDTQVKADIALAKELNTQLSTLLNVKAQVGKTHIVGDAIKTERLQKATADAAAAQERLKTATTNAAAAQERLATASTNAATAQERLKQSQMRTEQLTKRITDQTKKQNKAYLEQSRIFKELKGYALGYLSIHGASKLLSSLVRVTGEFELQKTTLGAMLGDLNKAEGVVTRIQGLAVESPFQFKELTTYAKQLSAFSVPAEELYDTTKMLADVSAGLGVGMDRIVLAYGQVRSAAFLRGQEVRQFTEAGIPILDELAKQFTEIRGTAVSTAEVFDLISKRMVPFEMVAKIFKDMTSEGGKFFNMQAVQAETLKGKISNLKDAYEVMLNEIGKNQSENLKDAVDWAKKLMQNYEETGRVLVELITTYGIYKTTLLAMEVATNSFALANHKLITALVSAGKYLLANPYVAVAAAITGVAFALYKQHTALEGFQKIQKEVTSTQNKYTKDLSKETAKLDALYAKLKLAKKGTEEYSEARKEIYSQYAGYISELRAEGKEVSDLAGIYDALKEKIENATRARTSAKAQQRLSEVYDQELDAFYDEYIKIISNAQAALNRQAKNGYADFSEFEKAGFWKYLTGAMTMWDLESTQGLERVVNLLNNANLDAAANLKKLRIQITSTTNEYNKSLKQIKKAYGELDNEGAGGLAGGVPTLGGESEDPAKKIQSEIEAVRRLKDAYDTLAPYMNGEMLRKTLTALFPNADQQLIQSLDFRGKLVELAGKLNEFDKDAAKKLLDSISGEKASGIASIFKEIEQYKKTIDSWMREDFNLTGEGVTFDISKIVRDLNNQYAKINEKAIKASDLLTKAQMGDEEALKVVREAYGEEVWQKYLVNGQKTIDELAKKERDAAKKTADEKIRDLSDKYVKEQMDKKNIDLSDMEDKSIAQIQGLIARMEEIQKEAQQMADKSLVEVLLGNLDEGQYAQWKMMLDVIEQVKQKVADVKEELEKKLTDATIDSLNAISDLGGEISSLGDSIDNSGLEQFGKELERTASAISGIVKALEADDMISLISNLVSYAISSITNVLSSAFKEQQALNDATREYRELLIEIRREAYSGVFGTDEMGLAAENAKILAEAQEQYQDALDGFINDKKLRWNKYMDLLSREKESVADVLESIALSQKWSIYNDPLDRNSGLNIEAIKANYDAYVKHLTRKQKEAVDAVIEGYDAQNEAAKHSAEYMTEVFSDVADSIADGMINAFLESGDAAIDMGDIISDVSRKMVADLIKSIYLMPILEGYQKRFAEIQEDSTLTPSEKTEAQLNLLDTALQEISGQSGAITDVLTRFEEYLGGGEEGTKDLGENIKGVTEDQANLLASYLNAIRADVSYSKALWVRMDANLQKIADMFTSSPTLMEYQAQIAANTYNTAIATQDILSELRSVITTDSGDTAIRVYS